MALILLLVGSVSVGVREAVADVAPSPNMITKELTEDEKLEAGPDMENPAKVGRFVEAIGDEVAMRSCLAQCKQQFGDAYPCAEKCRSDLCAQKAYEGEDRRFMPSDAIPPDCLPHHQVYRQALKKYQQRRARIDLDAIRKLIEEARQHADTAQGAVQRTQDAWSLAERSEKSATWAETELHKVESPAMDAREACEEAPTLARMDALKEEVVSTATESRDLLSRTTAYTDEACKIAGMVAPNDRDPFQGNRQQKVHSLLGYAREHAGRIGSMAEAATAKARKMLEMQAQRKEAWRQGDFFRDALAPVVVSGEYAVTEIAGLLARLDSYPPLLDQAEEHARQAYRLKAQALELINRQHHWSMSRFYTEQEQHQRTTEVSALMESCNAISPPNAAAAKKTVDESREIIVKALGRARLVRTAAQELDGTLTKACARLAESAGELVKVSASSAEEARASQQDVTEALADAEHCGGSADGSAPAGEPAEEGLDAGQPEDDEVIGLGGFSAEGGEVRQRGDGPPQRGDTSGQGGFVDEGSAIHPYVTAPTDRQPATPPSRRGSETVTYFERPWLPQSWKTSGDSQQTRAHIYQAASRLGWAAALAEYTPGVGDKLVIDHLNATAGHLQRANQHSFAPHKAWPDWQRRKDVYGQWIRRLSQGSDASKAYFRKGLDNLINTEASSLRGQLKTLTRQQAGSLANCDSQTFQIGYDLAYAAQVQSIALDGMKAGKDKAWARRLMNKASASATSAGRHIQEIKPTPQQKGCADYTALSQELNQVKSHLMSAAQPELYTVWNHGLAIASGGAADASACAGELEGYWWHPTGTDHIIHWVKNGDQYEGIYELVIAQGQQYFKQNTAYQWVHRSEGRKYSGKRERYSARERKYYYEPLNIEVLGDYYFAGPKGIYYGGYAWRRISPSDISRIQTLRLSLGGEILIVPGEKRLGDVEEIKVDCTGNGNSGNGSADRSIHLLGR